MIKIMFVCHGNICRSPMAEFIMKDIVKRNHKEDKYLIDSTATSFEEIGNDIYPPTKIVLKNNNISFARREARRLKKSEYDLFDIILVMDRNNLNNIERITNDLTKVKMLGSFASIGDISDPWYSGKFEECFKEIKLSCEGLFKYLEETYK